MKENRKHIVITGANRGIGLEFVNYYKEAGCEVTGICRQTSSKLDAVADQVIAGIDVAEPSSYERLKEALTGKTIDVLINNAGIFTNETVVDLDFQRMKKQFDVNTLGPIRVTEALLALMAENSKIALITSRMGSITDNTSGGYYGYRMSKAALNAAGKCLSIDLKPKGIAVAILHPGYVQTEMVGFNGDISPQVSAKRLAQRIEGLNLDDTGTFWHSNGEELPW